MDIENEFAEDIENEKNFDTYDRGVQVQSGHKKLVEMYESQVDVKEGMAMPMNEKHKAGKHVESGATPDGTRWKTMICLA